MIRNKHRTWITGAVVVAVLAGSSLLGFRLNARAVAAEDGKSATSVKVATYDPQAAFEQYPGREKLIASFQSAQQEMQQAQQEGNQQKMMELQQRLEEQQNETIQAFEDDVAEALPKIAKEANVKIIALQVVYTADDVEKLDVTEQVAKAIK